MKAKKGGMIVYVLLGLVILGLGGFGVTNFASGTPAIGSVGGREISANDYARAIQAQFARVSQQIGQPANFAVLQAMGLDQGIRAQLLANAAMYNEAARIGISVGDAQVLEVITATPGFQGLDGSFDRETYRFALQQDGMSETEYETKVREDAGRRILQGALTSGIAASDAFTDTLVSWAAETRDFSHVQLVALDLAQPVPEPTEAELKVHYDANVADFTSPETRQLTYVWLKPEALADEVEIAEEALQRAYDSRRAEFVIPEMRMVERLVFATEADAMAAKARIDTGAITFADLAAERGLELADIDLGEVTLADLGPAGAAVFAMAAPGVVGPLPSDLGPALYTMNAVLPGHATPLADVRDEIADEMKLEGARRLILERAETLRDDLAAGEPLDSLAETHGMELGTLAFTATTETGIAAYAGFRQVAEALGPDDFPELTELKDGGVFAVRLDGVTPPAPIPLAAARADVATAWKAAETQRRMVALGAEILAQVQNGATLENLGLVVTRHRAAEREGFIEGLPKEVLAAAFATAEAGHSVLEAEGVHLVRVDKVIAADPANPEIGAFKASVSDQIASSIAGDIFSTFVTALESQAGISLDQAVIEAVHAQMR